MRGAGGWGGERGPSADVNVAPERAPDAVVEEKTDPNQALLYRLSRRLEPAARRPELRQELRLRAAHPARALHRSASPARHVIAKFCPNGDPRFFKSIKVRFADTVFPGETLVTEMWKESDTKIVFRTKVKERDKVVISNAAVELFKEIPKKAEKPAAKPAAAARRRARRPRPTSSRAPTSSPASRITSRGTPSS